jgi:hypothetical protein
MKRTILIMVLLGAFFAGNMPAPGGCGNCKPGAVPAIYTWGQPGPTVFQVIRDFLQHLF